MIVDSQCHVSPLWYEPVENLLYQMDSNHVDRAILLQMLGQTDNDYQQDCVRKYPGRFSSVVLVDTALDNACETLRQHADDGAVGIRLRPAARSPGDDPLAIWRAALACGLAVSCVGAVGSFAAPEFGEVIAAFPDLPIILEHLGGSSRPDANEEEKAQRQTVFELARFPNVYLKLPGLGELAARKSPLVAGSIPFDPVVPSVLRLAMDAFGPMRLMWGSDFPPVSSREGYRNALNWTREALSYLSPHETESLFGGLASRLFSGSERRQ